MPIPDELVRSFERAVDFHLTQWAHQVLRSPPWLHSLEGITRQPAFAT